MTDRKPIGTYAAIKMNRGEGRKTTEAKASRLYRAAYDKDGHTWPVEPGEADTIDAEREARMAKA